MLKEVSRLLSPKSRLMDYLKIGLKWLSCDNRPREFNFTYLAFVKITDFDHLFDLSVMARCVLILMEPTHSFQNYLKITSSEKKNAENLLQLPVQIVESILNLEEMIENSHHQDWEIYKENFLRNIFFFSKLLSILQSSN